MKEIFNRMFLDMRRLSSGFTISEFTRFLVSELRDEQTDKGGKKKGWCRMDC